VAKATLSGKSLNKFTDTSISAFLLSPLLLKKGGRPSFVLKAKKQRSTPSERSFVTAAATVVRRPISQLVDLPIIEGGQRNAHQDVAPDGVGYTWAEFESYFDADIAAAIREAAEVDAAREPNSPRFDLTIDQGSILSS